MNKYRIQNIDGTFFNAGTGFDSWFNLDKARMMVDYNVGQRIVMEFGYSWLETF